MIGKRKLVRVGGFNPTDHAVYAGNLVIGRIYQETPDTWAATYQGHSVGRFASEAAASSAVKGEHLDRILTGSGNG